jgi:hypothetical protein
LNLRGHDRRTRRTQSVLMPFRGFDQVLSRLRFRAGKRNLVPLLAPET